MSTTLAPKAKAKAKAATLAPMTPKQAQQHVTKAMNKIRTLIGAAREAAAGEIGDAGNSPFRILWVAEGLLEKAAFGDLKALTSANVGTALSDLYDVMALLDGVTVLAEEHPAALAAGRAWELLDTLTSDMDRSDWPLVEVEGASQAEGPATVAAPSPEMAASVAAISEEQPDTTAFLDMAYQCSYEVDAICEMLVELSAQLRVSAPVSSYPERINVLALAAKRRNLHLQSHLNGDFEDPHYARDVRVTLYGNAEFAA